MSNAAVDIYVNDTTVMASPVAGVTVRVMSEDGSTLITQGTTDVDGHAGFSLPDTTTYELRFYKFQVGFTNPQLISVIPDPGPNQFNVAAQLLTPPVPLDARLCAAFGYFRDITGAPQANVEAHFIAKFDPVWLDGAAVLKERVIARSDSTGYMQLNLIRNGQYDVTIQGEEDITRQIVVPDAPNVNLPDLIFPIISLLLLDPPAPYSVGVGAEVSAQATFYGSDGENLGAACGQLMFAISDPTIFSFNYSPTGGLTITGAAPGTATLTITRADLSIVHIPDPGITNGVILVTVTP